METPALVNPADVFRETLKSRIIGQDTAINFVVDAYVRWRAGLAGVDKPVASFLMSGPTGSGKTFLAENVAEILHGDVRTMIKIHCAEYRHSHEISRLIGAPPGYIGHKETVARFSQRKLQEAQSKQCSLVILLLDEIEKAHPDLWDLLLGVLDKGDLHLGDGSVVDLRQTILFLTSNVGEAESATIPGYVPSKSQASNRALKKLFSPEFRNRLTAVIQYNSLSEKELSDIAMLEVKRTALLLLNMRGVMLTASPDIVPHLLVGKREFGARPIRREIERQIELPLAHMILSGDVIPGDEVAVSADKNGVKLSRVGYQTKAAS